MTTPNPILPGATLGVFGGGQLARMFILAAARMGYHVVVFAPQEDCPAAQVAGRHICAEYSDTEAVKEFAQQCDVVTLEFENVPVAALELASGFTLTRPGPAVLRIAQDRVAEREFLDRQGLATAPHRVVSSAAEAKQAVDELGVPCVLKTATQGYDGLGQRRIDRPEDGESAWQALNTDRALCEGWIKYQCELSMIVGRSSTGQLETLGPIENAHVNHILDVSLAPARVGPDVAAQAAGIARQVAEAIGLEGVMCIELFLTTDGQLLVNELAPRPHNSGHLSIEACPTSQFEQQVRAICGLKLGDMPILLPAAMANLLGDLWANGEPDWSQALGTDSVNLHLYGKRGPRPGRKMGHLTATARTVEEAQALVLNARKALTK